MTKSQERQMQADRHDAATNPLYKVAVRYITADKARQARIPIDPALPADAKIGVLNHAVAHDPKYAEPEPEVKS